MRTLSDIELQDKDRTAVRKAARLLKDRFPVEDVVLFGSKARGDDDAESDIDLLVLTRRALSRDEEREMIDALFDLELHYGVVYSPVIVSRHEWTEGISQALPLKMEVEREGLRV